jgi:hypothetical protein
MAETESFGRNRSDQSNGLFSDPGRNSEIRSLSRRAFASRNGAESGTEGRTAKRNVLRLRHGSRKSKRV